MAAIVPERTISETAYRRLRELFADMGWRDEAAVKNLFKEVGRPLGMTEKAVKQWLDRETIPGGQIFNIATAFGIDASWLAGTSAMTKEEATDPYGLYAREMDRVRESQRKRRA